MGGFSLWDMVSFLSVTVFCLYAIYGMFHLTEFFRDFFKIYFKTQPVKYRPHILIGVVSVIGFIVIKAGIIIADFL